jgi:hypothetical protein
MERVNVDFRPRIIASLLDFSLVGGVYRHGGREVRRGHECKSVDANLPKLRWSRI